MRKRWRIWEEKGWKCGENSRESKGKGRGEVGKENEKRGEQTVERREKM